MASTRELTLLIDSEIDDELTELAKATGRDKQSLAHEALIEWLEEQEDIRDAREILAQDNRRIPLVEVKRELGLAS
ncbi:MAG TPA: hypothetical protein VNZ58_01680 [Thermomicrobiales bacterium]|nr:hypothetical protein [Thermomicrobiales bacterium]